MSRPLLVTDCDEVLLHMVAPFGRWLDAEHDIDFTLGPGIFFDAMRRRADGLVVPQEEMWPLLGDFFETQMASQTIVPHARESIARIAEVADVVVLTNLLDHHQPGRTAQLKALGIDHRVQCNQGGKGVPVARLIEAYAPSAVAFVDDLAVHHESVMQHAPQVHRLHMVSEPLLAPHIPPAEHAHARIDDWLAATEWLLERLGSGLPAEA